MTPHITQEQADEFAIGSLDPATARAVEAHAESCAGCAGLVEDARFVASSLGLAAPRAVPRPSLRRRVFQATGIVRPRPFAAAARMLAAATGIAAVAVAIVALTGVFSLRGDIDDLESENLALRAQIEEALSQKVEIAALTDDLAESERTTEDLQQAAAADRELLVALLSPSSTVAEVYPVDQSTNAIGRFVWDEEQKRVWFVASDLRPLPAGQSYQLWVNAGGDYVYLGALEPDESGFARFRTVVPQGLGPYESAVVTVEQDGSIREKSGPAVFVTDLSRLKEQPSRP
jgi:anti-sigma-K factor RskA